MQWNDASSNPPTDGDVLLACDNQGCYFVAAYFDGRWDTVDMKPVDVMYWMELPPCPEAVGELDGDDSQEVLPTVTPAPLNGDSHGWAAELFSKTR